MRGCPFSNDRSVEQLNPVMSTQSDPFAPASQWPMLATQPLSGEGGLPVSTTMSAVSAQSPRYQRGNVVNVWGLPLDQVTMEMALESIGTMIADRTPRYVITANLNYAMLAAEDRSLGPVTDGASMILADGQPMVWRSLLNRPENRLPCRVAGSEMIFRLAEESAKRGWRIYFLGAEPGVAQACADNLAARYPGMVVAGVQSPPYRKLTDAEVAEQIAGIRATRPDILLVAFGQPKGEKWIIEHLQSLGVPVSIQVGASFDFAAGTIHRAPRWMQRLGLEWAHRMMSDPKRLMPRYWQNFKFLAAVTLREAIEFTTRRCRHRN
jgi:N-acetylglucosaminyldiphosphoundecaprenol N-acetyl-beta-D-mannosaminyltransferase